MTNYYISPCLSVVEVQIEKGFSVSEVFSYPAGTPGDFDEKTELFF